MYKFFLLIFFSHTSACFSSIFLRLFICLMWVTGTLRLLTSIRRIFPSVYIIVNDARPQCKTSGPRPRGDYICIWAHVTPSIFFSQEGFTGVGSPAVKASVGV